MINAKIIKKEYKHIKADCIIKPCVLRHMVPLAIGFLYAFFMERNGRIKRKIATLSFQAAGNSRKHLQGLVPLIQIIGGD